MYDKLCEKLREVARQQSTTHYEDIAPMLGLMMGDPADRVRIGQILGEISKQEHDAGRPMLSAVVTHKGDERPGLGFFELAQELGLVGTMDSETFFIHELKRVHRYWANPAHADSD